MSPRNPWTLVPAADYEGHMGPEGADQLAPLSAVFARACRDLRPARLLVPGVGTGNGLEHVDPAVTERVVGLDVNLQYLAVARQRHGRLGHRLELFCAEVEHADLEPASFDLAFAALLFEHVDAAAAAARIAGWLAPGGSLVAVLQLPSPAGRVSPSRFAGTPAFRAVAAGMRLVPPEELGGHLGRAGLVPRQAYAVEVAHETRLFAGRWLRPK
ncbi:MAG TPA: class I SAM-dependent methyltransferase [Anaeromyxobacteraceae bacterium]|jgi:hypothetical protein